MRREGVARSLRDAGEPVRRALTAVQHSLVVGQVHELVDEVGLADVGDDRAQLLVGAEAAAPGGARGRVAVALLREFLVVNLDGTLLEHLSVVVELDPAFALALAGQDPHQGPEELFSLLLRAQLVDDADAPAGHLLRQLVLIAQQAPKRLLNLGEHRQQPRVPPGVKNEREEPRARRASLLGPRRVQVPLENRVEDLIANRVGSREDPVPGRSRLRRRRRLRTRHPLDGRLLRKLREARERAKQPPFRGDTHAAEREAQSLAHRDPRLLALGPGELEQRVDEKSRIRRGASPGDDVASRASRALRRAGVRDLLKC